MCTVRPVAWVCRPWGGDTVVAKCQSSRVGSGGGFVQRHELLCAGPGSSGAVLEDQGHIALGSRLDLCLLEIPRPRQ